MSAVSTTSIDSHSEESLKVLHANQLPYASINSKQPEGLTAALALRYAQAATFYKIGQPPVSLTGPTSCPLCSIPWIPGWSYRVRLTGKTSSGHAKKNSKLSKRARKRKSLRAQSRQELLKVKLANSDKILRKVPFSEGQGSEITYKCLSCLHTMIQEVPDIDRHSYTSFSSIKATSSSLTTDKSNTQNFAPDLSIKKKRSKSKKGTSLSKLVAQKEERAKTGFSLGLSDFLAKK